MDARKTAVARACLESAEDNTMTFPQIAGTLIEEGFEGYMVDFRRAAATYYGADGDSVELPMRRVDIPVAPALDAAALQSAIREAQQLASSYTYEGFCRKAASSGVAGYLVSFSGRRALYFSRAAEIHVERFPD